MHKNIESEAKMINLESSTGQNKNEIFQETKIEPQLTLNDKTVEIDFKQLFGK